MRRAAAVLLSMLLVAGCARAPVEAPSSMPLIVGKLAITPELYRCDISLLKDSTPKAQPPVSQVCGTDDLKDIERLAQALPTETTLIVFDIDDTILTASGSPPAEHFFGSDRWYRWQKSLNDGDKDKISCLYSDILALDYETSRLHLTQSDAAEIFNHIPNDKMFLTSRHPNYRGGTERELRHAGVILPKMIPGVGPSFFRMDTQAMTYADGIYMTGGANKGDALLRILRSTHRYSTVILADDGRENIEKMMKALASSSTEISYYGLQYIHVKLDPYPNPLPKPTDAEIKASRASMTRWLALIHDLYPERYSEMRTTCGDFR